MAGISAGKALKQTEREISCEWGRSYTEERTKDTGLTRDVECGVYAHGCRESRFNCSGTDDGF